MQNAKNTAVCCMSGGYKNVFAQGVLNAFEKNGFRADAYAACSSSVLIAAYAAFGQVGRLDLSLWEDGYALSCREGDQSGAMLESIRRLSPEIKARLWRPDASRLLVAASYVKTDEAARITQSEGAKRQGQMLLIQALRGNSGWKDQHLEAHIFDTQAPAAGHVLAAENFEEAAYATTRMLHAWRIPAAIGGMPYIDGSYTVQCPASALAESEYRHIVCVCTEEGRIAPDLFSGEEIPSRIGESRIDFIKPRCALKELGVDFFTIHGEGLEKVFQHGYECGAEYLRENKAVLFPVR